MHPSDLELIRFARKPEAERDLHDPVAVHLTGCGLCRGEVLLMEEWLANQSNQEMGTPVRSEFEEIILRLLRRSATVIPLLPLTMPERVSVGHTLAADGLTVPAIGLRHRATLYSEDPEVILRVMHDPATERDVLQLVANDPALTKHVFISYGEPPMDVLTDERGTAEVAAKMIDNPVALSWRLRLPDSTFTFKPLDAPNSPAETIIDLPNGDRIAVATLSDASGLSLRLRPVRIHGQEKMVAVRVVVCQSGGRWQVAHSQPTGECVAANLAADEPIEIRLYVTE